ncbi:hypothetical protein FKM82_005405 [Ascaphus truei]
MIVWVDYLQSFLSLFFNMPRKCALRLYIKISRWPNWCGAIGFFPWVCLFCRQNSLPLITEKVALVLSLIRLPLTSPLCSDFL